LKRKHYTKKQRKRISTKNKEGKKRRENIQKENTKKRGRQNSITVKKEADVFSEKVIMRT
jgi:hypothetical protein